MGAPLGECRAAGCFARVFPFALFCDRCWRAIPADIKRLIDKHHRPGKRASRKLEVGIEWAIADLLELKTTGRHIPTSRDFMWDDEPPALVGVDVPLPMEHDK